MLFNAIANWILFLIPFWIVHCRYRNRNYFLLLCVFCNIAKPTYQF